MEMETDGPDEDQLLMLSKAPSMTMLNEREVSHKCSHMLMIAALAPRTQGVAFTLKCSDSKSTSSPCDASSGAETSGSRNDSEIPLNTYMFRRNASQWQGGLNSIVLSRLFVHSNNCGRITGRGL